MCYEPYTELKVMNEKVEQDQLTREMDFSNYFKENVTMLEDSSNIRNEFDSLMHFFNEERKERKKFVQITYSECFDFFNVYDDLLDEDKKDFFKKMRKDENHFVRWTNQFHDQARLEITQIKNKLEEDLEDQND